MAMNPNFLSQMRAAAEARNPQLAAQRIAQEQAAAAAARPYEVRLAEAQAAQAAANKAAQEWKPTPEQLAQNAKMPPALRAMALGISNPNRAAPQQAAANVQNVIKGHIKEQLNKQASGYGFGWKGNKSADYHSGQVAQKLMEQGITDLTQLGYSKDKNYLINKETGQQLKWYKQDKHKDNPLKNKGQLGWAAKGKGRTNYMVQPDAQGNPVLFPKWKSNAPKGVGGFLLKAAPVLTSFIPGIGALGAAAINAGLTGLQGGNLGAMLKSGALAAVGNKIGNWGANTATANLPMIGNAGITNAIADAAGGALSGGVRSAIQGQDPLTGAAIGGAGSLVGSGVSGLINQVPGNLTGNALIDKYGPQVVGGLLNTVAKQGISGLFASTPGQAGQGQGQAQGQTGIQSGTQPGVNTQQGGVAGLDASNLLPLMALMGQNQPAAAAPPPLYSGPTSSTNWLYSAPQQPQQTYS